MPPGCRRPQESVQQMRGLIQFSPELCQLISNVFSVVFFKVLNIKTHLIEFQSCSSGQSAFHLGFFFFYNFHPLLHGGRSERRASHQARQDAHWPLLADCARPGQSDVAALTFSLPPWPWWEVKCVAGSSQYWHSRLRWRRRKRGEENHAAGWEVFLASFSRPPPGSQVPFSWIHDRFIWPICFEFYIQGQTLDSCFKKSNIRDEAWAGVRFSQCHKNNNVCHIWSNVGLKLLNGLIVMICYLIQSRVN